MPCTFKYLTNESLMLNPTLVIDPRSRDLGDGFLVRRVLPWRKRRALGPFVFWDHMGPLTLTRGDEMQVRPHPHIGLSTLTYLFSGKIRHRDTLGNIQDIEPGAINWMTAGRAIAHSERTHPDMAGMTLEGIQIWIALPTQYEEIDPSFIHLPKSDIPTFQHGNHHFTLIAGEYQNFKSPVPAYSELFYLDIQPAGDELCSLEILPGHESALYIARGEIQVGDTRYSEGQMLVWDQTQKIEFTSSQHSRVLAFGGKPLPEKRYMWWNFVSSRPERIEQAKRDWQEGRFGMVIEESEQAPLPQDSY